MIPRFRHHHKIGTWAVSLVHKLKLKSTKCRIWNRILCEKNPSAHSGSYKQHHNLINLTYTSQQHTNKWLHSQPWHRCTSYPNNSLKAVRNVVPIFHTLTIILDVSVPPIRHTSTMIDTSAPPTSHLSHHSEVFAEIPLVTYHWKNQCNCDNHDSFNKFQPNRYCYNNKTIKLIKNASDAPILLSW